jgi:hypothetical protein
LAPLGHHWQDATHITFGVATVGLYTSAIKLEGSIFNGREPDATRTNFDLHTLDSYSGRLTVNPGAQWSASASYGYLKDLGQHRMTASVLFDTGKISAAAIYGANLESGDPRLSNSVGVETTTDIDKANSVFGRVEWVQKTASDLALPGVNQYDVEAMSIGYTRQIAQPTRIGIGLGGIFTVNLVPQALEGIYGSRAPVGFDVFVRFRPAI